MNPADLLDEDIDKVIEENLKTEVRYGFDIKRTPVPGQGNGEKNTGETKEHEGTRRGVLEQRALEQRTVEALSEKAKLRRRSRVTFFNSPDGVMLRLQAMGHYHIRIEKQQLCALCGSVKGTKKRGRKTINACSLCHVHLCVHAYPPYQLGCWDTWHTRKFLAQRTNATSISKRKDSMAVGPSKKEQEDKESDDELVQDSADQPDADPADQGKEQDQNEDDDLEANVMNEGTGNQDFEKSDRGQQSLTYGRGRRPLVGRKQPRDLQSQVDHGKAENVPSQPTPSKTRRTVGLKGLRK